MFLSEESLVRSAFSFAFCFKRGLFVPFARCRGAGVTPAPCSPDGAGASRGPPAASSGTRSPTRESTPLTSLQPLPPSFFPWPPAPSACGEAGCKERSEPRLPFFGTGRDRGAALAHSEPSGTPTRGWAAMLDGWTWHPGLRPPCPSWGLESQPCSHPPPRQAPPPSVLGSESKSLCPEVPPPLLSCLPWPPPGPGL